MGDNMVDKKLNSVKGLFNRNQKSNNTNKKKAMPKGKQKLNPNIQNINLNQTQLKKAKQMQMNPNQKEMAELDSVVMTRMREIENTITKLVADVQFLDSKNPALSSKMTGMLVEMIINLWKIGNILIEYQENNQLAVVKDFLSKQEQKLLKILENPNVDVKKANMDLDEIKGCQKIVEDSLRPINTTVEYYNLLMSKLSNWGFEVKNPIGQKYDAYMDIDVLAFEEANPNFKEPMITETKKPEIYFKDNKILKAQVIVTRAGAENNKKKKNRKKGGKNVK